MDEETKKEFQEFLKYKAIVGSWKEFWKNSSVGHGSYPPTYTYCTVVNAHQHGFESGIKYAQKEAHNG